MRPLDQDGFGLLVGCWLAGSLWLLVVCVFVHEPASVPSFPPCPSLHAFLECACVPRVRPRGGLVDSRVCPRLFVSVLEVDWLAPEDGQDVATSNAQQSR